MLKVRPQFNYYEDLWSNQSSTFEGTRPVIVSFPAYDQSGNFVKNFNFTQETSYTSTATIDCLCRYFTSTSDNLRGIGSPVGYARVTEILGENGEDGKNIYTFENPYFPQVTYVKVGLALKPPGFSYSTPPKNGLMLSKESKDISNNSISQTMYQYSDPQLQKNVYGLEKRRVFDFNLYQSAWTPTSGIDDVESFVYPTLTSSWVKLEKVTEILRSSNSATSLTTNTEYRYDNIAHRQTTTTITEKSDGRLNFSFSLYPEDYNQTSGFVQAMVNRNIVIPIETITGIGFKNAQGDIDYATLKITGGSINTYNINCPVCMAKTSLLELPSAKPILFANFKFSNTLSAGTVPFGVGGGKPFVPHSTYSDRVIYNNYVNNNLTRYTADGLVTDIVWTGVFPTSITKNSNASGGAPALTTTYVYDPLFGVLSQTEPNGLTTTYKYDGLGRLQNIKNNKGQIVKSYQYNYRPQ